MKFPIGSSNSWCSMAWRRRWIRLSPVTRASVSLLFYFGQTDLLPLQKLARQLFEQYPLPVMEVSFRHSKHGWQLTNIAPYSFHLLENGQQDSFAAALERFSRKIWQQPNQHKRYRYDLAILLVRMNTCPPQPDGHQSVSCVPANGWVSMWS